MERHKTDEWTVVQTDSYLTECISFTFEKKKTTKQTHTLTIIKIKRKLRDLVTRKQRQTTLSDVWPRDKIKKK